MSNQTDQAEMTIVKKYQPDMAISNITELSLTALERQYEAVPDVSTAEGMDECKAALKDLRTIRLNADKYRKEIKEPALQWCDKVQKEWNRIEPRIKAIEARFKKVKEAEEAKKEAELEEERKVEQERINKINNAIEEIKNIPLNAVNSESNSIKIFIEQLKKKVVREEFFEEYTFEAQTAHVIALEALNKMLEEKVNQERRELEMAARERELAEERRIQDIKFRISQFDAFVTNASNSETTPQIKGVIERLASIDFDFQEFNIEAEAKAAQVSKTIYSIYQAKLDEEKEIEKNKAKEKEIKEAYGIDMAHSPDKTFPEPVTATSSDQMMSEEAYEVISELLDDEHASQVIFEALVAGAIPHVNIEWKH